MEFPIRITGREPREKDIWQWQDYYYLEVIHKKTFKKTTFEFEDVNNFLDAINFWRLR